MNPQRLLFWPTFALLPLLILSQSMWSTATWSWISGNSTADVNGVYGTKSVPSVNNFPGSRYAHSMTIHPSMDCMFVFGGQGYAASTSPSLFHVYSG